MKKVILAIAVLACSFGANAQLKVYSNGTISMGATSGGSSWFQATLHGNKNGILQNSYGQYFRCGQGSANNAVVGSTSDQIDFWYSGVGHNTIIAYNVSPSDSTIKTNIEPLENGMDILKDLESYTYYLKEDVKRGAPKVKYGFISQIMEQTLPDITVRGMDDILCMDYNQVIPILVKGTQEQQALIESQEEKIQELETELDELKNLVLEIGEQTGVNLQDVDMEPAAVLYQNRPNPFKERTTIKYDLPEVFTSASIMVFDMTGEMLEQYPISTRDGGQLVIEGRQFKPGMYLYSLIVDDVEIDTKKMILNK